MKKTFLSWLALLFALSVQAQSTKFTVSGNVVDASSGEDLAGATILVKEMPGTGAYANEYGFFSLTLPAGDYTLIGRFVSYDPVEVKVKLDQDRRVTIDLSPEDIQDDERLIGGDGRLDLDSLDALTISLAVKDRYGKHIDSGNETRNALSSINHLAEFIVSA